MRKDTLLFVLGLIVFLTPFLGIPGTWKDVVLFVSGFLIVVIAFVCRLDSRKYNCNEEDVLYVENVPEEPDEVSADD
jgi:hypothetical protein